MTKQFEWLNETSRTFLQRDYLEEGQSAEQRIRDICDNAQKILLELYHEQGSNDAERLSWLEGFSDRMYDYMGRGYISFSTPVWINFGNERGLPVSCFNSYIDDTVDDILEKAKEVGVMSKMGGGTSGYLGAIRPRGAKIQNGSGGLADGPVRFLQLYAKVVDIISQGSSRRGSFAAYLPIDHPDIMEFLQIREPGNPMQEMNFAVTISDEWMESLQMELAKGVLDKFEILCYVIKRRYNSGFPYILFSGNANKQKPQVYKDKGYEIVSSNLCNEIMLPSTPDESFVCVLSSLNLRHWDAMKETDVVEVLTYFLDAVNEEFVRKASKINGMERAARFARRHRALGLGALGWHSYLQENMIPWETMEAKFKNLEIWETIRERADWASEQMAADFGEPEVLQGYGRRNTTTLAVAPTSSSSTILGQMSPGIEPYICNYYVNNSPKGTFTFRNPYFEKLLDEKGKNTAIVWDSVLKKDGSVQHLNFLSDEEKEVFKTWEEISQKDIIIQASQRQKFIDQGQSLNLMVHPYAPAHEIVYLIFDAWKLGAKGLYYQRSGNPAQKLSQSLSECKACQ